MVTLSHPYRTLASQGGGRSLGPQLSPLQGPLGPLAAAGGIRQGFGSLDVNFVLETVTSRVPPPAARPALISAAVRLLSSRLARSLRPLAPSLRTLLEVCGGLRPCLALCRMSRPFVRFGGLVGCTLLDVCGRLRALDIYIYTPVYLYIGALAAAGGIRHGFGSLGVNFVLKTVTSRVPLRRPGPR